MNTKSGGIKAFVHNLEFQKPVKLIVLVAAILFLTAVLSVHSGSSTSRVEAAASALVCPAGIISYWQLDEDVGATTFADSVSTNDATCNGPHCPNSVPGRINRALDFDGIDDRVNVADNDLFDWASSDSFSIELWVQTSQDCTGDKVYVGKHQNNGPQWWLGCRQSGAQGLATFSLRDDATNQLALSGAPINDGAWHHLVAIRDASTGKNLLYVDGVAAEATQNYTGSFANNNPLTIGYRGNPNAGHADAIIDDVALYTQALTEAEILEHYNGGVGQVYCEPVAPQIDPVPDQAAVVGQPFTYDVDASGDPAPTFSLDNPPTGMTIDANAGVITWTPDTPGAFDIIVHASNSVGTATENFTITVGSAPVITPIPDQAAVVNQPFIYDVQASGSPSPIFSLDNPPTGMTIDANTGVINWTPDTPGAFDITVVASNSVGTDTEIFTINVAEPGVEEGPLLFLPVVIKN